ncbi:hypothetical protein COLO4_19427 [Corchorus olitorius]|uniref:Uncharacterized protein n=1 Tax=Corchorus olitorius TaxID=93759 RepID=A0A1R3J598_9ROSI|nr:hypothetical protein COLO4_19427 [Corchorus olitorius]
MYRLSHSIDPNLCETLGSSAGNSVNEEKRKSLASKAVFFVLITVTGGVVLVLLMTYLSTMVAAGTGGVSADQDIVRASVLGMADEILPSIPKEHHNSLLILLHLSTGFEATQKGFTLKFILNIPSSA